MARLTILGMAHFAFAPGRDGWALVSIGDHWSRVTTQVGYMEDPLAEVLKATLQLLDGEELVSFRLDAEPPDSTWTFRRVTDEHEGTVPMVAISIVLDSSWADEDDAPAAPDAIFEQRMPLIFFATAVLNGAECLVWRLGESGYSERWTIPQSSQPARFPVELVEAIRQRLSDRGVQSDLEWLAAMGWSVSLSQEDGASLVMLVRASDGRTVTGRGLDPESAIARACFHLKAGMPDYCE